jgi:uncharacterized protein (DUF433 family)
MGDVRNIVNIDPEIMGGAAVFAGTRVPRKTLTNHLVTGDSLEGFLDGFPSVSRDQAVAYFQEAERLMVA